MKDNQLHIRISKDGKNKLNKICLTNKITLTELIEQKVLTDSNNLIKEIAQEIKSAVCCKVIDKKTILECVDRLLNV